MVGGSQQVVVAGSSCADLSTALELRKRLPHRAQVAFERFLPAGRKRGLIA